MSALPAKDKVIVEISQPYEDFLTKPVGISNTICTGDSTLLTLTPDFLKPGGATRTGNVLCTIIVQARNRFWITPFIFVDNDNDNSRLTFASWETRLIWHLYSAMFEYIWNKRLRMSAIGLWTDRTTRATFHWLCDVFRKTLAKQAATLFDTILIL